MSKYGKIMWRAIKQMWGRVLIFFYAVFLQKLGKLVGIYMNENSFGEILVKCPNLDLEKKVSKNDKIENVTSLSQNEL